MLYTVERGSLVTKNYVTSFFNFRPTNDQRTLLRNILTQFNSSISRRFDDARSGLFQDANIKFNPQKDEYNIYPFELPYNLLIKGNTKSKLIGREIWPGMLNLLETSFIPNRFLNYNLSEDNTFPSMHISLTPLVNYKRMKMLTLYKQAFEKKIKEIRPLLTKLKSTTFTFQTSPKILSNYDYSTFYLVLPLSQQSCKNLKQLSNELSHIRIELLKEHQNMEPGVYPGEEKDKPVLFQPCIHYTLGKMKIPARKDQNLHFGMYETYYMNEVLLKTKSQLSDMFGAKMHDIHKISDRKLSLNAQEIEKLKFIPTDLTLSMSGGQLRYPLST